MTHEEFMNLYDDSLRHGWVTSKIASIAAKQKEREREYNKNYYRLHSDKWNRKHTHYKKNVEKTSLGTKTTWGGYDAHSKSDKEALLERLAKTGKYSKSELDSMARDIESDRQRNLRRNAEEVGKYEKGLEKVASLLDVAGNQVAKFSRKAKRKTLEFLNKVSAGIDDAFFTNHAAKKMAYDRHASSGGGTLSSSSGTSRNNDMDAKTRKAVEQMGLNPDDFQRSQRDSRPSTVRSITQEEFDSILAENGMSRKKKK